MPATPANPRDQSMHTPARVLFAFLFVFFILASTNAQSRSAPAPLVLKDLGRATMPVDGTWQFHLGDNLAWASPALDDSGWEPIEAGKPWDAQGHWDYTGFAWYRRRIVLAPGSPADIDLALFLPKIENACEVYWNGKLVGGIGKVPPHPVWYESNYPGDSILMGSNASGLLLGPPQSGVLAIRVWKAPMILFASPMEGGLTAVPQMGSAQAVAAMEDGVRYQWLRGNEFTLAVVLLCVVVSLLCLFLGFRNRRNRGNTAAERSKPKGPSDNLLFWLAVAMAFPLANLLLNGVPGLMPFRWNYGLVAAAIGIYEAALWMVLIDLLGLRENRRLVRWTWIIIAIELTFDALDGSLQIFDWSGHPRLFLPFDFVLTLPTGAVELWGVVLVLFAFRRRNDAARWMLAICALAANVVQALDDLGGMGERWTHWTIDDRINAPLFTVAGSPLDVRTITNTLLLVAILYAAWRYLAEASQRQSALEQEYLSAQEVQRVLIPESLPDLPGYAVTSAYRPAQEVGGDFFQLIPLAGDGALLAIGDVSGKGLHAAMTVALIVGALRSTVETTDDPAAMLTALNRRLHGRLRSGFVTCLVLRLDAKGNCVIANAGHLPPFLNGTELALPSALPLGLLPEAGFESTHIRIAAGDRLTLYTDGLLEARNHAGELFGFTRVAELVSTPRDAQQMAQVAQEFGQEDDITVLTLTYESA